MRVSARWRFGAVLSIATALGGACARIEPPPGGPPDRAPPRLLSVKPDSGAVLPKFSGEVEFRFDEVISEGSVPNEGTGTGDLERLVILSPTTRVPKVHWRRSRLTVEPAEGWKPNRVYRVQLLPGITDLRRNRSDSGVVVTFTTGAPMPETTLTGTVIDWTTRRPVAGALVIAVLRPDSLPYRALADSNGAFAIGPLPRGDYIVYGVIDQDRDQQLGRREAYDSAWVPATATKVGELWAFVRDSAPPRIQAITVDDSASATIEFSQMLDPNSQIPLSAVRLRRLPDSTTAPVTSLLPKPVDDSLHRKPEVVDTTRHDSVPVPPHPVRVPREPAQVTSRPPLFDHLVLRVPEPWQPGSRYVIEIRGIRNATGTTGNVQGVIIVPERKTPADSLRALHDSLKPPIKIKKP